MNLDKLRAILLLATFLSISFGVGYYNWGIHIGVIPLEPEVIWLTPEIIHYNNVLFLSMIISAILGIPVIILSSKKYGYLGSE